MPPVRPSEKDGIEYMMAVWNFGSSFEAGMESPNDFIHIGSWRTASISKLCVAREEMAKEFRLPGEKDQNQDCSYAAALVGAGVGARPRTDSMEVGLDIANRRQSFACARSRKSCIQFP